MANAQPTQVAAEPLVPIGGRFVWVAALLGALIIIPFTPIGTYLANRFGPQPEYTDRSLWKEGAAGELKLTLITADASRLACAHDKAFGDIHCENKTEQERWPREPNAPLDDNNAKIIQPYRTSPDNQFVMVSGVWAQPAVAWRLHREPPQGVDIKRLARFVAACKVTFLGTVDGAKTRWAAGSTWQSEQSVMVAKAESCDVIEE